MSATLSNAPAPSSDKPDPQVEAILDLQRSSFEDLPRLWGAYEQTFGQAWLGRVDRYYLLVKLLRRRDAWHPWIFARSREMEADRD
jgi:hypothetical protein